MKTSGLLSSLVEKFDTVGRKLEASKVQGLWVGCSSGRTIREYNDIMIMTAGIMPDSP